MTKAPAGHSNAWSLYDSADGGRGLLASLYFGDGVAGLRGLDHDPDTGEICPQVDHVICDPPYEAEAHTKSRRTRTRGGGPGVENYAIDFDAITEEDRLALGEAIRSSCRGWSLVFCQVEAVAAWRDAIGADRYMRTCAWVKPDSTPQLTGDRPGMGFESIVCHWHGVGKPHWYAGGKRGVYTHRTNEHNGGKEHPTQKPLSLMRELVVDFTASGDLIADPYTGSGTTGLACLHPHRDCAYLSSFRRFVGWENKPHHFDTARRRLQGRPRSIAGQKELF